MHDIDIQLFYNITFTTIEMVLLYNNFLIYKVLYSNIIKYQQQMLYCSQLRHVHSSSMT